MPLQDESIVEDYLDEDADRDPLQLVAHGLLGSHLFLHLLGQFFLHLLRTGCQGLLDILPSSLLGKVSAVPEGFRVTLAEA